MTEPTREQVTEALHRTSVAPTRRGRMLYTCGTEGCECAGAGFTDESGLHCSICLEDLVGVYDLDAAFQTDDEIREALGLVELARQLADAAGRECPYCRGRGCKLCGGDR